MKKETLPLTKENRTQLKKGFFPILIFILFAFAIFFFIFKFVLKDAEIFPYFIFGIVAIFFSLVIFLILKNTVNDLREGVKEKLTGHITDKRLDIKKTTTHTGGKTGSGSRTKTTKTYFISLDGNETKIEYKYYNQSKVGDLVSLERSPNSGTIFQFSVLEKALENTTHKLSEDYDSTKQRRPLGSSSFSKRAKQLSRQDKEIVRKQFMKGIPFSLLVQGIIYLVLLGFWFNDMEGFALLLSPLTLVAIFMLIKLIIKVVHYKRSISEDEKIPLIATVMDKTVITSNRQETKMKITTSEGVITLKKEAYENVQTGTEICLFVLKYIKRPFAIQLADSQEFYTD